MRQIGYKWITLICLLAAGCSGVLTAQAQKPNLPTSQPVGDQTTDDQGTNVVAAFYRALLQKEPPTAEQEQEIFIPKSALRSNIAVSKLGLREPVYTEPMTRSEAERAKWREFEDQVAKAGPLMLNLFRAHKDLFLPKNMTGLNNIQVSTTFNFIRNLERVHTGSRPHYVLVLFTADKKALVGKQRGKTLVFKIKNGKINPDAIYMDGFSGKTSLELFRQDVKANHQEKSANPS